MKSKDDFGRLLGINLIVILVLDFLPVKKNVIVKKIENEVLASISLQGFVEIFTSHPKNFSFRNRENFFYHFRKIG